MKIYVEPEDVDFSAVAEADIFVELVNPTALTARVSHKGVSRSLVLTKLRGVITKLSWKKTKTRLVLTLDKKDTALGWDREWSALISDKKDGGGDEDGDDDEPEKPPPPGDAAEAD